MGRSYAVLGSGLERNHNIGKRWRCGQNQFHCIMCWLIEMGELFRAVACRRCTWGCQRGLCHGGWTVETRCGCPLELQRPMSWERKWWVTGKLFMKLFNSLISDSVHECFYMLVHFGISFIFWFHLHALCMCVCYTPFLCSEFQNIPPQLPLGLLFKCVNLQHSRLFGTLLVTCDL